MNSYIQRLDLSWHDLFNTQKVQINNIIENLAKTACTTYPAKENYFKAFELTAANKTKVIILGQDPYHNPNQANGLCFSVPSTEPLPASLKNIYKALHYDVGKQPMHGDLSQWATQGVLLLNTCLTVEKNKPNSHKGLGWQVFTTATITYLNHMHKHLVFLLWGSYAQQYTKIIAPHHTILTAPHPSPLSAYRGFLKCRHFSKTNQALMTNNQKIIDWMIY